MAFRYLKVKKRDTYSETSLIYSLELSFKLFFF